MKTVPFTFRLEAPDYVPSQFDNHITRRLTVMDGKPAIVDNPRCAKAGTV